jgi:hypothetical protein
MMNRHRTYLAARCNAIPAAHTAIPINRSANRSNDAPIARAIAWCAASHNQREYVTYITIETYPHVIPQRDKTRRNSPMPTP